MKGILKRTAGTGGSREDEEKLTNEDYDTIVEFEIVERLFLDTTTTFREAKIKWNNNKS